MGKRQAGNLVGGPGAQPVTMGHCGTLWDIVGPLPLQEAPSAAPCVVPLITLRQWIGTQRGSGDEEQARMGLVDEDISDLTLKLC